MRISVLLQLKECVSKKTLRVQWTCSVLSCGRDHILHARKTPGFTLDVCIKTVQVLYLGYRNLVPAHNPGNIPGACRKILCGALGCCANALELRLYLEFKYRKCHSWQCAMEKAVFTVHGFRLSWNFLLWVILWKRSHRNLLFQVLFGLIVDT